MENKIDISCITFSSNKYWMETTKVKFIEAVELVFGQYEFYRCLCTNSIYIDEKKIEVSIEYDVIDWPAFLKYKDEVEKDHNIIVDAWPTNNKVISVVYTRKTLEKDLMVLAEAAEGFRKLTIKHRDLIIQHHKSAKEWFEYLENLLVLQGIMYNKHTLPLFVDGKMKAIHWRLRVKAPEVHSEAEEAIKKDIEDYLASLERVPNYKPVYFENRTHAGDLF